MIEYPIRCKIIDVVGEEVFPGVEGRTPDESKPHIGKMGLAEETGETGETVRITLDDGTIIYGSECWWEPIFLEHSDNILKLKQIAKCAYNYLIQYYFSEDCDKDVLFREELRLSLVRYGFKDLANPEDNPNFDVF